MLKAKPGFIEPNKPLYAIYDNRRKQFAYLDMKWIKHSNVPKQSSCAQTKAAAQEKLERFQRFLAEDVTISRRRYREALKDKDLPVFVNLQRRSYTGAVKMQREADLIIVSLTIKKV